MLEKLLNLIRDHGVISPSALSSQLGISPRLLEVMLEDLQRRGYLDSIEEPEACASGACQGCAVSGSCGTRPRVWQLRQEQEAVKLL
jgi:hypothetical protein